MTSTTFRLILLVSCAHALVHVFELSLPSVEQLIGEEFGVGRERTGMLGTAWRLPFGMLALLAGWLADRFGSKPLLILYLCGCVAMSLLAWWSPTFNILIAVMFAMGCFASIYHPAGLALISRETTAENRGMALGWHGILGSIGIASAPFMAALVFSLSDFTWRQYYLVLTVPAAILAVVLYFTLTEHRYQPAPRHADSDAGKQFDADPNLRAADEEVEARWGMYALLVSVGAMSGFIYAAFLHFLPRYLDTAGVRPMGMAAESFRNYLTAIVLLFAVAGQAFAGKIARPGRLEWLLAAILLLNAPALLWMATAEGRLRLAATCTLALIHFMSQPVYNSLIAQYVPRTRRSTGYGFSNMMCFSIGALGPTYAGLMQTDERTYGGLAVLAVVAGATALLLRRRPA